ncbi:MAG: DUF11 domain-containing protein, partial [Candidatus Electrothrix sp. GM3_4]|nr:DUF11 domain-containing protein [Candidatus Electrothrix sp. GM3_4]
MGSFLCRMIIVILVFVVFPITEVQAAPAGYTEYYIPADEGQLFEVLDIISLRIEATSTYTGGMHAVISVTAWSDDTTIYYDHWEDGYDFDPDNPASSPADETYHIRSSSTCVGSACTTNKIITFENDGITLPRLSTPVTTDCNVADAHADKPVSSTGAGCFYDGRDRVYIAGGTATMSRAGWITNRGTVLAVAWEVYPVRPQLTTYTLPFGEELPVNKGYNDFERVFAFIQSTENGSVITVDYDGDGNPDQLDINRDGSFDGTSVTLNQGEVFLLSHEAINDTTTNNVLSTGTAIESDKTLQVQYVIGDEGSQYQIRGLSAFPRGFWDNAYYIPMGSPAASNDPTDAYVYNPHATELTVSYATANDSGSFKIPPQSVLSYYDGMEQDKGVGSGAYLPRNSSVYLSADDVFWGVVSVDTEGQTHDWAHSMVPASLLADEHYLAWAPGAYPVSTSSSDDSGLYIAAAQDHITVFIDYNNGQPVQEISLNQLELVFIYDNVDGDLSKAHIWSTGKYTAAYGQNPDTAVAGDPAIDVGYTIISATDFVDMVLNIDKTVDPITLATAPGQQSTITLKINSFSYPVDDLVIEDLLPPGWEYVAGSAVITMPDGSVVASGVSDPLFSIGDISANQSVIVTFTAETTQVFNDGDITKNEATVTGIRTVEGLTQTFVAADKAFHLFTDSSLAITKTSNVVGAVSPGDTITYTVEVENDGPSDLTGVSLYDELPEGVSYVAGSGQIDLGTQSSSHNPPNFLVASDGYALASGESLTLTFNVTVNDPFPTGQSNITNIAEATSSEVTIPETASVTDPVVIAPDELAIVGDRIWFDLNNNGVVDVGESGIAGVAVTLKDEFGTPVMTAVTDSDGFYTFDGVSPGNDYWVQVDTNTLPGYDSTSDTTNLTQTTDGRSDHRTDSFDLAAGDKYLDADIGYIPPSDTAAFGDLIWSDANGDNTQDSGEVGLGDVTVELWRDMDGDGIFEPGGDDEDQDPVTPGVQGPLSAVTADNGSYLFTGAPASGSEDYFVTVDTGQATLTDWASTGFTTTVDSTVYSYAYYENVDAGDVKLDADFGFDNNAGTATIKDRIWFDVDADGDDDNPATDNDESGISSVTVVLKDSSGDIVSTVTVTSDSNGEFEFVGVPVGERYIMEITDVTGALSGYYPTTAGATAKSWQMPVTLQGDVDYTSETPTDRNDGETEPHFGFSLTNAIGDTVFEDNGAGGGIAGNGIQDGNEPGIAGVEVKLYADINGDGDLQDGEIFAGAIATTTTDTNGNYLFAGLTSDADYVVSVTTPSNYTSSPGIPDSDGTTAGEQQASSISVDGAPDLDRDFGYVPDPTSYSINGSVWENSLENAVIDGSENEFEGVTVALYENDGTTLITTTTTDINGNYFFNALDSGDYVVRVTDTFGVLGGYDPNYEVTEGVTTGSYNYQEPVKVGSADENNINFGFIDSSPPAGNRIVSGQVRLDGDGDGDPVDSDSVIVGVIINLYSDPNGDGDPSDGSIVATKVTDAIGNYSFDGLASAKYVIMEEDPAGHISTHDVAGSGTDNLIAVDLTEADVSEQNFLDALPGAIGNRIWLDENGDGIQDAGEAGIPNVMLELRDSGGLVVDSTVTGDNGEYIFTDIPPGDYTIHVVGGVTDLHNTYDKDTGATSPDNETSVSVVAGETNLTIDFGYNWVDPTHTDNPPPGATGAIGDRIWNDANGDGVQGPGESGLENVTVSLLTDDNNDGVYGGAGDNPATITTTDATGHYIFDGLEPNGYVVEVTAPADTTQTGDPDESGITATLGDNRTTAPVVLAPGDVYVNADFGYKTDGMTSTIGDRIYLDADGDGIDDGVGSDPGFAGVTVTLKNGSGEIIGYDVTDKDGKYSFPGLLSDTYTVKVTDTRNVLGQFTQTGDPDGIFDSSHTLPAPSTPGTNIDTVDFGYAPAGHSNGDGLIGDTIFLDTGNGSGGTPDGVYDAGEGIQGVTVQLYDDTGTTLLATTVTDVNGQYRFGGLDNTATYQVHVNTATLPNGGAGLTNFADPEGNSDSSSMVDLSADADGIVLDRDFGYRQESNPNSISGTLWNDTNADGTLEAGETGRHEGVTVILRDSNGNIVATTTTDSNGDYSFGKLPDGTYTVEVDDQNGSLEGFWHSIGPNAGDGMTDNNSQPDAYSVTVSGGQTNTTGDFGYYRSASAVGNFIWEDEDGNGRFDSGESPIPNQKVTLLISYLNGDVVTLVTETDTNGEYSFANLLADENYQRSGSGANQPTYVIKVDPPAGMVSTHTPATDTADADNQADNPEGEFVVLTKGEVLETKDFGFRNSGSIGDYVWLDINGDGNPDLNESPLGGVTVKLYLDGGDGVLGVDDVLEKSVLTALDGSYLFENLPAGTYWVQVDSGIPASLEVTDDVHHDNTTDQSKPADKVVLVAGGYDDTVDFGFNATTETAVLGDTVWFDIDPDGAPGGTAPNGIQDSGEIGIAGVGLYICLNDIDPCDGTNDIDTGSTGPTVITEADGSWLVPGLIPGQTYTVAANTSTLPIGMNSTPTNGDVQRVYNMPSDGSSLLIADYGFT